MDNQDKLFNQIKSAAQNAETKDFASMDKVWNRVEEKLDKKVLKKETKLWKKIAVAASVLLVVSLGYQLFKDTKTITNQENEIVSNDSLKIVTPNQFEKQNAIVESENVNTYIKKDAAAILEKQITTQTQIVSNEYSLTTSESIITDSITEKQKGSFNVTSAKKASNTWHDTKKFESRGVEYEDDALAKEEVRNEKQDKEKKQDPLLVIDGKVSNKSMSNLDENELESIIELKEPLYIINSVYYTEKDLFGPNPTSPYAPLNKQKIETISILQPEKATTIYGEKGKKGIVIVTTKDGKPLSIKE